MATPSPTSHTSNKRRLGLTPRILIGLAAGIAVGLLLFALGKYPDAGSGEVLPLHHQYVTDGLLQIVGQLFLRGLQLLVVPIVFVSLVAGTAALEDIRQLGRLGIKTLALYLFTTLAAISMALTAAVLLKPGTGFADGLETNYSAPPAPDLVQTLLNIIPTNPFEAMSSGNMLQIIVFAILFGISMAMAGKPGKRMISWFQDMDKVVMKLVDLVMLIAPYGVFALIARTFATQGYESFGPLAGYFGIVVGVLLIHMLVVYPALLTVLGRLNPVRFMKKMWPVQLFAFSTASSNATIPFSLETAERRLGVDNSVASFTIPLGATINMDGTAIMQGVATAFIAQAYGIDLSIQDYLIVIMTATLASIGTAGVPGVGLVMLAMVLRQVGLPAEGIGLIIGIDRLLDMLRTSVNITGDAAVTCIVARSENEIDLDLYNTPVDKLPDSLPDETDFKSTAGT